MNLFLLFAALGLSWLGLSWLLATHVGVFFQSKDGSDDYR